MYVPFELLPQDARVWIYPVNRDLNPEEEDYIAGKLKTFVQSWKAHGAELRASCKILFRRFIVLAVDENYHAPSGCSIDSLVRAVTEIILSAGHEPADRGQVFFLIDNMIKGIPVTRLRKSCDEGQWNATTAVFDTTVTTLGQLMRNPFPAGSTWLARYLKQVSV